MKFTKTILASAVLSACALSVSSADAALVLSADGNTVYATDTNLTWLDNANLAATNTFGMSGIAADGSMSWSTAKSWIAAMNATNYLGYHDWRLPTTSPINGSAFVFTYTTADGSEDTGWNISAPGTVYAGSNASEMAHLYYVDMGGQGSCIVAGSTVNYCNPAGNASGLNNNVRKPFVNLDSVTYWSSSANPKNSALGWNFTFGYGIQLASGNGNYGPIHAWAVRTGQVAATSSPVPVPAAAYLLGSGLIGLIGVARKKTQA